MLRYFAGAVHNRCALRLSVRRWLVALPSHQPQVLPAIANLGPRFRLRVLARAGSSTLNVSGRRELGSITYSSPRPPSLGGGTGAIAESRAAGAEQPALVARLIPMAARCAAPPGQPRARSLWERAHSCRWLSRLRRKCGPLTEVRVLRFAISHELSVDLWQSLVGSARSRNPRIMGAMQSTNRPSPATMSRSIGCSRQGVRLHGADRSLRPPRPGRFGGATSASSHRASNMP